MLMKARLAGAHKGHGLLKKKADALQMRFRLILSKIIEVCELRIALVTSSWMMTKIFFFLDQNIDGRSDEGGCIFTCRSQVRHR